MNDLDDRAHLRHELRSEALTALEHALNSMRLAETKTDDPTLLTATFRTVIHVANILDRLDGMRKPG